jgi:hypothetical protein
MQLTSTCRSRGWRAAVAVIALAAVVPEGGAGADAPDPIFAAARDAVAAGRIVRTELVGFDNRKGAVRDEPPPGGGILVGFEVGLGEWVGKPAVYSLKPLYLTPDGVKPSQPFGLPQGWSGTGKKGRKSEVKRTVTVQARDGYAVGAVFLDTGLIIDAIAVHFMRIQGTRLDPAQSYTAEWQGSHQDKKAKLLDSGGDPIVGVFAREDEVKVVALGLTRMRPPEPAPAPAPPAKKPGARSGGPPPPEAGPKGDAPDRAGQKGAAPAEAQPPAEAAADTASGDDSSRWLFWAVFGGVTASVLLGAMLVMRLLESGRRQRDETPADRPRKRRRPRPRDDTDDRRRGADEPARPGKDEIDELPLVSDDEGPEDRFRRPAEDEDSRIETDRGPERRARRRREPPVNE